MEEVKTYKFWHVLVAFLLGAAIVGGVFMAPGAGGQGRLILGGGGPGQGGQEPSTSALSPEVDKLFTLVLQIYTNEVNYLQRLKPNSHEMERRFVFINAAMPFKVWRDGTDPTHLVDFEPKDLNDISIPTLPNSGTGMSTFQKTLGLARLIKQMQATGEEVVVGDSSRKGMLLLSIFTASREAMGVTCTTAGDSDAGWTIVNCN